MNIIGLIAEYNPFHNGHLYNIEKIKELYPDSLLILVLNGYFTQRGTISVLSKEDKTKISLDNNIDIDQVDRQKWKKDQRCGADGDDYRSTHQSSIASKASRPRLASALLSPCFTISMVTNASAANRAA